MPWKHVPPDSWEISLKNTAMLRVKWRNRQWVMHITSSAISFSAGANLPGLKKKQVKEAQTLALKLAIDALHTVSECILVSRDQAKKILEKE